MKITTYPVLLALLIATNAIHPIGLSKDISSVIPFIENHKTSLVIGTIGLIGLLAKNKIANWFNPPIPSKKIEINPVTEQLEYLKKYNPLHDNYLLKYSPLGKGILVYLPKNKLSIVAQDKIDYLTHLCLKDPQKLIEKNEFTLCDLLTMQEENDEVDHQFLLARLKDLEYPLAIFSECNADYCPLTRKFSNKRHKGEIEIEKKINEICPDKNSLLIYTSFGSGFLFQDMIMITKLIKSGYRNIHINLIDTLYAEYLQIVRNNYQNIIPLSIEDEDLQRKNHITNLTYRFA